MLLLLGGLRTTIPLFNLDWAILMIPQTTLKRREDMLQNQSELLILRHPLRPSTLLGPLRHILHRQLASDIEQSFLLDML
jgi:hypothetical protein